MLEELISPVLSTPKQEQGSLSGQRCFSYFFSLFQTWLMQQQIKEVCEDARLESIC